MTDGAIPLTITDAGRALRDGSLTSVALTEALLDAADRLDETHAARGADEGADAAGVHIGLGADRVGHDTGGLFGARQRAGGHALGANPQGGEAVGHTRGLADALGGKRPVGVALDSLFADVIEISVELVELLLA